MPLQLTGEPLRGKRVDSFKETGEEVAPEEWERFEAAAESRATDKPSAVPGTMPTLADDAGFAGRY